MNEKWDERYSALAELVGSWSKDPSTKTGCVIVRPNKTIASVGYNGFPRGVLDLDERLNDRPTKYAMVVHAETNAIIAAAEPLVGCTIYVHPWFPCSSCAAGVIQAGITRVVSPRPTPDQEERWGESWRVSETLLTEAGVKWELV